MLKTRLRVSRLIRKGGPEREVTDWVKVTWQQHLSLDP